MNAKKEKDIKSLSKELTNENKRYVLAVANALVFSQNQNDLKKQTEPQKTA